MPTRREIDPQTGEIYLVTRDEGGRVVNMWQDPGVMGAQNQAFMRRISNYGRKIADVMPQDPRQQLDRAAAYAQDEPYYQALREEYPIASGAGELVAGSPAALLSGGRSVIGQGAANIATAVGDEWLNYDPLQEGGDYLDAATWAAGFDVAGRGIGRVLGGIGAFIEDFGRRGMRVFRDTLPDAADQLTARGYKIARPSQLVDREHPLRGIYESMEMASESSALPSQVMRENADFNAKRLSNTLAEAMGLKGKYDTFTPGVLADAEKGWHKARDELIERMPKTVTLPYEVADQVAQTDWARDLARKKSKQYPGIMRYMREMDAWDGAGTPPAPPKVKAREFFEIRSDMTQEAKLADIGGVKRDMAQRIDALDAAVVGQTDPKWAQDFAEGREQWEVIQAARNPAVIGKEGKVNLYALARSLSAESNFGRSALYGDDQFTNPATANLAGDVAALLQPETYANSRTTDRRSWLKFAQSIIDDPVYAASTAANTTAVNAILNQSERGMGLGGPAVRILSGVGSGVPGILRNPVTGDELLPQLFSYGATRPEEKPTMPGIGLLPSPEVRDQALAPFIGAKNDIPQ